VLALVQEQAARRQAEEAVLQRDEFLSVAAHELRTPVTRLRLAVQLTSRIARLRGVLDGEDLRRRLDQLDQETAKLSRLVVQLLDVSRIERGRLPLERTKTDLTALTRGVVELLRVPELGHDIVLDAPEHLEAEVDPLRIEQVLTNLLDNAAKYSLPGGPIRVELSDGDPRIARFTIRDWGVGVPTERRAGIFGRFFRAHLNAHIDGLGIGLYVTRQIVELHGGTIEAHFPEDGGSEFIVTLPRQSSDVAATAP
jgi:two-component system, OmpR family, sensor kinase